MIKIDHFIAKRMIDLMSKNLFIHLKSKLYQFSLTFCFLLRKIMH